MVIPVYKNKGETPLAALSKVKSQKPEYTHIPMTYAGRLGPMAEGLLLILTGEDCMKKDEYTALSKEYEVTVLFGFATDTYDLLGIVETKRADTVSGSPTQTDGASREIFQQENICADENSIASAVSSILPKFSGKINQKYPPYSSRTVNGKPLFQWAREGKLNEIEIPTHEVFISKMEIIGEEKITKDDLRSYIKDSIAKVVGDFRQEEILKCWDENLNNTKDKDFVCVKLSIACSSGTYVRVIAQELGQRLGIPSLAIKIVRTKIGDYKTD